MLLNSGDGHVQFCCYLVDRIAMDASKDKRLALLPWQTGDNGFQTTQFVASRQHAFIASPPAQLFQIGHIVQ